MPHTIRNFIFPAFIAAGFMICLPVLTANAVEKPSHRTKFSSDKDILENSGSQKEQHKKKPAAIGNYSLPTEEPLTAQPDKTNKNSMSKQRHQEIFEANPRSGFMNGDPDRPVAKE